jgi:prevent-host-death family protein
MPANADPAASVTVNIFQAKTQLSKLIEKVERGEDVIIARAGKPVARLTQLKPAKKPIVFGLLKGKIHVTEDFDAPLPPEVLAEFEGDLFPPEHPAEAQATQPKKKAKAR